MIIHNCDVSFIYGQRNKNFDTPYHYKEIEVTDITLDKPVVFAFGGTGTYGSDQVNGYLKLIENLLGVFSQDVNIIGINYNFIDPQDNEAIERDLDEFVNNILLKNVQKDGSLLEVQEACKKIRNITIFGHCYGKSIAERIVTKFESGLLKLGYSQKDCAEIVSQIFIISHAAEPKQTKCNAKRLSVVSPLDTALDDTDYAWRLVLKNLNKIELSLTDKEELESLIEQYGKKAVLEINKFYRNNKRVFVVKDEEEIYLASSIPLDSYWWEHALFFAARDEDYKASKRTTEVGDYVSKCLLCALCNSVANSMINNNSKKLVELNLNELKLQLENVVKPLNSTQTISCLKID